jgi:hypothetical protein
MYFSVLRWSWGREVPPRVSVTLPRVACCMSLFVAVFMYLLPLLRWPWDVLPSVCGAPYCVLHVVRLCPSCVGHVMSFRLSVAHYRALLVFVCPSLPHRVLHVL